MARPRTRAWDVAASLRARDDGAAYLEAALDAGDAALVAAALGDIARASGMTAIARDTGLGRESLYKALSPKGDPEFATVLKVLQSIGLKLHASAASGTRRLAGTVSALSPPSRDTLAPVCRYGLPRCRGCEHGSGWSWVRT